MDSREEKMRESIQRIGKARFGLLSSDDMRKLEALLGTKDEEQLNEIFKLLLFAPSWRDFLTQED